LEQLYQIEIILPKLKEEPEKQDDNNYSEDKKQTKRTEPINVVTLFKLLEKQYPSQHAVSVLYFH
jgi:hypothetical protein